MGVSIGRGLVCSAYRFWLDSNSFDCSGTISTALYRMPIFGSQEHGALMRVSPLGISGARHDIIVGWTG